MHWCRRYLSLLIRLKYEFKNLKGVGIIISYNWPQCPSTEEEVVVVVVVTVRCLRWDWSTMGVSKEASDAVLLSWTMTLLLLFTGVLTAEKERVFLGVAAWLRDRDRPLELDCCFLLRSVLEEQKQQHMKRFDFCCTYVSRDSGMLRPLERYVQYGWST